MILITLFFFVKIVFAILGPVIFHINFRISLSKPTKKKKLAKIWIGIALNL